MRKSYWKILAVLLLTYTFVAGLLVPLKPGIYDANPSKVKTGETITLYVNGYNSHYTHSEDQTRLWLKLNDKHAIQAQKVKIINDTQLEATFHIPPFLPLKETRIVTSLILDHIEDGAAVSPDEVVIQQASIDLKAARQWATPPPSDLHIKSRFTFPFRSILYETIRNTYYHVPLWMAMMILFIASVFQSFKYLYTGKSEHDWKALSLTTAGTLYGMLGLATGMLWEKSPWGTYWTWEKEKLNMTAIAMLIYLAYFILRGSFVDAEKRGRISAVYNIFAFAALIPLIFVIPRMTSSLHPGNGGNPAIGSEDLDHTMRMVFYPAIIGWTLLGVWMASLLYRAIALKEYLFENQ
ncbi:MAG TPA: cytochrome c assembly protein [Phaeodactylibacter sp.]|nr:cytochrome c assembly protein [Phaeodactylibacter sp.]